MTAVACLAGSDWAQLCHVPALRGGHGEEGRGVDRLPGGLAADPTLQVSETFSKTYPSLQCCEAGAGGAETTGNL